MKYKLEIEEEEYAYEGWAFLHFHTLLPGYALANALNRLYDYSLERLDDMPSEDGRWPLYRFEDTVGKMLYFLVLKAGLLPRYGFSEMRTLKVIFSGFILVAKVPDMLAA